MDFSMEGYVNSPSAVYPVRAHRKEDGIYGEPSGRLLGWRMHFNDRKWKGGELIVSVPLKDKVNAKKIAELLFTQEKS